MAKKKQRKARKGFTRSAKEWEKSIATHIGKFIDKLTSKQIMELITNGIVAYAGYKAVENIFPGHYEERTIKVGGTRPGEGGVGYTETVWVEGATLSQKLGGAASALIALKLACSMNLVAGASGTAYLAGLGLLDLWGSDIIKIPEASFEKAKAMPFPFGFGTAWTGGPPVIGG